MSVVSTPASPAATPSAAAHYPGFDPSMSAVDGAFSAAMNAYVRGELKFEDDLPYGILAHVGPWTDGRREGSAGSVARQFAAEMKENPHLRVLVLMANAIWPVRLTAFATISTT